MTSILLIIYIIIMFVRPMDWWEPVYAMPLLDYVSLLIIPITFFSTKKEDLARLWELPEIKIATFFLFSTAISFMFVWFGGAINAFREMGKVLLSYGLILLIARNPRNFRILLWTYFLCIAWLVIHGILQIYTGAGFGGMQPLWRKEHELYQIRAYGFFNDPNDLCMVFICTLPLLYVESAASRNMLVKIFALVLISMVIFGTWLTNSRGGIIALVGMIGTYIVLHIKKGVLRGAAISIALFGITVLGPSRVAKMGVDFGRVVAWGDGITAWKASPIWGIGWNNFTAISDGMAAHNSFIETLTELGLLGYIPWFLLLYVTMAHLYRTINLKESISRSDYYYLLGFISALAGYLTGAYFLSRAYNHLLYILLAISLAKVINICDKYDSFSKVFGYIKADMHQGIVLAFSSIPFLWITIRIANIVGGRA